MIYNLTEKKGQTESTYFKSSTDVLRGSFVDRFFTHRQVDKVDVISTLYVPYIQTSLYIVSHRQISQGDRNGTDTLSKCSIVSFDQYIHKRPD